MATMQQILSQYGLTTDATLSWISNNLDNPQAIYSTTKSIGLNNDMLAQILAPALPGITGQAVDSYFSNNGIITAQTVVQKFNLSTAEVGQWLNANYHSNTAGVQEIANIAGLDSTMLSELLSPYMSGITPDAITLHLQQPTTTPPITHNRPILYPDTIAITPLLALNTHTGVLSTDYLRIQTLQQGISTAQYQSIFDPRQYSGHEDGVFTTVELGFSQLGNLSATAETLESVFYGTLINALRAIDNQEAQQLDSFADKHQGQFTNGTPAFNEFMAMLLNAFTTPTTQPMLSDSELSQMILENAPMVIGLIGQDPDMALMDGIFASMLP